VVREPDVDAMPLRHHRIDHNTSVSGHRAVFFAGMLPAVARTSMTS
jgi:hypothetical protein